MSKLFFVMMAIAATLGLCYFVFAHGDVQTLIPPPESVAEQFLRAARTGRYEIALNYLAGNTRNRLKEKDIKAYDEELKNKLGAYEISGSFSKFLGRSRAIANVQAKGSRGQAWQTFDMKLENRLWRIEKY